MFKIPNNSSQLADIVNNQAELIQEDWITPTLINSWEEVSGYPVAYIKDQFGFIHVKGRIQTGLIGNTAFILPEGYRPPVLVASICAEGNSTSTVRISIASDGSLTPQGGYSTLIDLSGVTYKVGE